MAGIFNHLTGIALLYDHTAVHKDHLVCHVPGKGHLVGDDNHGGPLLSQGTDHFQHFPGKLRIQGGGGLVKAENIRRQSQCPGNGHPLLLTAGKLMGIVSGPICQAHFLQQNIPLFLNLSEDLLFVCLKVCFFLCQQLLG